MEIIPWHRGETRAFDILPEDASGASTAASFLQAQMRISAFGTCVVIEGVPAVLDDGTVQGAGFRFGLNDAALEAAPNGLHGFAIWLRSSTGWECASDDFGINIMRGC